MEKESDSYRSCWTTGTGLERALEVFLTNIVLLLFCPRRTHSVLLRWVIAACALPCDLCELKSTFYHKQANYSVRTYRARGSSIFPMPSGALVKAVLLLARDAYVGEFLKVGYELIEGLRAADLPLANAWLRALEV